MLRIISARCSNSFVNHYLKSSIRSISTTKCFLKEETKDKISSYSKENERAISKSILEDIYTYPAEEKPKTFAGKAKQATVNTFWYACLGAAVVALGGLAYAVLSEFFSPSSPSVIFSKSLDIVRDDPSIQAVFGNSIAGYGEENRRGRRKDYLHYKYEKDGEQRIGVHYNIKGNDIKGRVTVVMANKDGSWDYRLICVETVTRPYQKFIVIDNRNK
ncbi:Mitochondrial import inner membrane translocase subunit Tim21 [Strongyloides ratti]|uniref:Mitochondrial import inner membrane translocase subunit Tim21 n=1 Tax=Strongyloides ratti TaxID=34506 RepID=A0A090LIG8_STRRB|nr:Mitochondrial import inner membrane translocase subunit Tim21 [Strongyloides ratti]CEF69542.1 Mitochondrial import inner membrane translocase subunit Tim21 [Strongyloides ratti]